MGKELLIETSVGEKIPPTQCYTSIKVFITLLLLAVTSVVQSDTFQWFERNWISDVEATRVHASFLAGFDEQSRKKYLEKYGKLRWSVSGGILRVIHPDRIDSYSPYTIRPAMDGKFEILTDYGGILTAWKVDSGFCMAPYSMSDIDSDPETAALVECFKPVGA